MFRFRHDTISAHVMTFGIQMEPALAAVVQREAAVMNVGVDKLIQQALLDYLTCRSACALPMASVFAPEERIIPY